VGLRATRSLREGRRGAPSARGDSQASYACDLKLTRILITGGAGQVGTALGQELKSAGDLVVATRNDLDLSRPKTMGPRLSQIGPDLIINAAAYTAVDKAEVEKELAYTVNAAAVEALGQWAAARNVPFIHFSTDYVFDGTA